MRNGILTLGALVLWTAQSLAQTLPPSAEPKGILGPPEYREPTIDFRTQNTGNDRIWGHGEYLLWWVKNAPLPVPLVTTGDPTVGFPLISSAGAIGQPSTRVLVGDSSAGFGAFSGMRFTLGAWITDDHVVGVEGSGFLLERRTNAFAAGSDGKGSPPLYLPAFDLQSGAERAIPISDPLRGFSGNVSVTSTLQLWGAEINGVFNVWRRPGLEWTLLAGFRYADLTESLDIHNATNDLLFFNTTVLNDRFDTRNQFYGGQLGSRVSWQSHRLSVDLTGKIALGDTHQVVNIEGDITQFGAGAFAPGTFPGGLYTQPTNIGRRSADQFTVMPAIELKVSYQITPRTRAVVGYDCMYWNQVVRPGNQIDRNINQSQSPIFGGGGALVGQAAPLPLFNRTDFWAQGVSFGLEFRF